MSKFVVGERAVAYCAPGIKICGMVTHYCADADLLSMRTDDGDFKHFHPKQCRRLVKKKKHRETSCECHTHENQVCDICCGSYPEGIEGTASFSWVKCIEKNINFLCDKDVGHGENIKLLTKATDNHREKIESMEKDIKFLRDRIDNQSTCIQFSDNRLNEKDYLGHRVRIHSQSLDSLGQRIKKLEEAEARLSQLEIELRERVESIDKKPRCFACGSCLTWHPDISLFSCKTCSTMSVKP